jgi:RNA polymerase sigma-70 factor (ECF subfamily)
VQTDEQLVAAYRDSGQAEALEELVGRYVGRIRGFAYQMVLDPAAADDLTQEVFLRVLRGLSTFTGRSKFSTWLYRLAMNTARSFLAKRNRSPLSFHSDLPETTQTRYPQPERAAAESELETTVEAALGDLSPKLRGAIVLTSLQNLEAKEAARIEGCTTATMYWRIHEARRQLKKRLKKYLS